MTTEEIIDDIRTNRRDIIDFSSLERMANRDNCSIYGALVDLIKDNYNIGGRQACEVANVLYDC